MWSISTEKGISGNIIENTNSVVSGAAIQLVDAENILITGNNVSQININGMDTDLTAGVFKLGMGETIAVTYDAQIPNSAVFAE